MVIGYDSVVPGFFWLVGQGGTGIQTAPAAAQLTADLMTDADLAGWRGLIDLEQLGPERFA
jgi:D-arginine dehydrogenase